MNLIKNIGNIRRFDNESNCIEIISEDFFATLAGVLETQESALIAVSEGSTPLPLYKAIAEKIQKSESYSSMAERTDVFLLDERIVPLNHKDSNGGKLLDLWKTLPFRCYMFETELEPDQVARRYQNKLLQCAQEKYQSVPVIDILLLGMGNDGHTASLFPGTEALANTNDLVVVNKVDQLQTYRFTMTFPVLKATKNRWVICKGISKIKVIGEILLRGKALLPIETLMTDGGNALKWYIT